MIRIRVLADKIRCRGGEFTKGETPTVDEKAGRYLIAGGYAEEYTEKAASCGVVEEKAAPVDEPVEKPKRKRGRPRKSKVIDGD